jgi:AsmA protein
MAIRNGLLDLTLASDAFYEGVARARYVFAPSADRKGVHQLSLSGRRIHLSPLLTDLTGVPLADGIGTGRVEVQGQNAGADTLLRSAAGNAEFSVVDGTLDNLDVGNTPVLGRLFKGGSAGKAVLRFTRLGGTFSIRNGQAVTNDLHLESTLIDAKGAGSFDFPGRTMDLILRPTVSTGPYAHSSQLAIPVRMSGPWSRPLVNVDFSDAMEHPAEAVRTLQDLGTGLLGNDNGSLGGILDSFLGKSGREASPNPTIRPGRQ